VNQRRRLQRVPRPLAAQIAAGHGTQLGVGGFDDALAGSEAACAPLRQQSGEVATHVPRVRLALLAPHRGAAARRRAGADAAEELRRLLVLRAASGGATVLT